VSDVYEFIDAEYATCESALAITQMCAWLEVSKSGFYEWRSRPESATARRREELKLLIKKAFDDSDGTYGYRRLVRLLPVERRVDYTQSSAAECWLHPSHSIAGDQTCPCGSNTPYATCHGTQIASETPSETL